MKKTSILFLLLTVGMGQVYSQATTAMQFSGLDCNNQNVDLFADLDAGKAVVLFYYMANCGSCPPPAQKIKAMANNINSVYPGSVKGYAFPYTNSTSCSYSATWVNTNSLSSIFSPMDSGATQVAHYGGFGMPTVVLVGGANHRVMFSTLNFVTGDTAIMRDSILALLSSATQIPKPSSGISGFEVFPNPSSGNFNLELNLIESGNLSGELADISGRVIKKVSYGFVNPGLFSDQFDISSFPSGIYFLRISLDEIVVTRKLSVFH